MVWMALAGIVGASSAIEGTYRHQFFHNSKFSRLRHILIFHTIVSAILFVLLIYYGIDYAVFGFKCISPASGISKFWAVSLHSGGRRFFIDPGFYPH